MSDILLIRHAETDMAGTFCGHSDPELNAAGLLQLEGLLQRIRNEQIKAVYSSDLRRAHTTAMAIAETLAIECVVSPALREINFGQWEGLTWQEIEQRDLTYARQWIEKYPHLPAPGGENFHDFENRVIDGVRFLSSEAEMKCGSIAVVTHAGVLRTVLTKLQGYSQERAWEQAKSYCSIVRYSVAAPVFAAQMK